MSSRWKNWVGERIDFDWLTGLGRCSTLSWTCPRWWGGGRRGKSRSFPPGSPRPLFPRLSPGLLAATSSAGRASLFLSAANWSALGVGPHHTGYSLANVNSAMEVICQLLGHVHTVHRPDATCFGFCPNCTSCASEMFSNKVSNAEMVEFFSDYSHSNFLQSERFSFLLRYQPPDNWLHHCKCLYIS